VNKSQPITLFLKFAPYIAVFVLGVIIGAGVSFTYVKPSPGNGENTYQAGFDAAKKRFEQSGFGSMFLQPQRCPHSFGHRHGGERNKITVHTQSMDPFEDPALDDRNIFIASDTKIFKPGTNTLIETMQRKRRAGSQGINGVPMNPPNRVKASLSDITVGSFVVVTAKENYKDRERYFWRARSKLKKII